MELSVPWGDHQEQRQLWTSKTAHAMDGRTGELGLLGAQRIMSGSQASSTECLTLLDSDFSLTWFCALEIRKYLSYCLILQVQTRSSALPWPQLKFLPPGFRSFWIPALTDGLRCGTIAGINAFLLKLLSVIAFIPAMETLALTMHWKKM